MNKDLQKKVGNIFELIENQDKASPISSIVQISYLLFLKILDEEESRQKENKEDISPDAKNSLFPAQAERFRWSKWKDKGGKELREFLKSEVFYYMASLIKEDPIIAAFFRDAVLEIDNSEKLKKIVNTIDSIDFYKLSVNDKGDIIEDLLDRLSDKNPISEFRTPPHIRKMMVSLANPDIGDTIFDPACGTGGFLADSVKHILAKHSINPVEVPIYGEKWLEERKETATEAKKSIPTLQTYLKGNGEKIADQSKLGNSIIGFDVSRQMIRITILNLVLHNIRRPSFKWVNALSEIDGFSGEDTKKQFKLILSNPPIKADLPQNRIRRDITTRSSRSEILFLDSMMQSLEPGGMCFCIVPDRILSGVLIAEYDIRKRLIENYEILAVISLPASLFLPAAKIKTSVLVFRRPVSSASTDKFKKRKVWFYQISYDGYDLTNRATITPYKNDIPELLRKWEEYRDDDFHNLPGKEYRIILPPDSSEPRYWWVASKHITGNNYKLSLTDYQPQIAEEMPKENPAMLIKKIISMEDDLIETLMKLHNENENI